MPFSVVYIGTYFPFQKRLNYLGLSSLPISSREETMHRNNENTSKHEDNVRITSCRADRFERRKNPGAGQPLRREGLCLRCGAAGRPVHRRGQHLLRQQQPRRNDHRGAEGPLRFAQRPNSALGYALHLFQSFPAQPMFSIKRRFRTTSLSLFVHIRPGTAHGKASQGILRLAGRNTAVQSAARVLTPRRTENRIVFPLPAPSECSQTVAVFTLHQNSPPPYGKRAVGFSFLLAAGQSLSMGRPWPRWAGNNGSSRSPG